MQASSGHDFPATGVPLQLLQRFLHHAQEAVKARKIAEASEERYRALTEQSGDGISVLSADGTNLYASPALLRILGYRPEEYLGRNNFANIHPDDSALTATRFREVLSAPGAMVSATFRVKHADGSWKWLEATATNRLDVPAVGGIVINYRDVTEREHAQTELLRQTTRLRLLLQLSTNIGQSLTVDATNDDALRTLLGALPETDTAALLLFDEDTGELVPRAFVGIGDAYGDVRLLPGEAISGIAFQRGQTIRTGGESEASAMSRKLRPENAARLERAFGGKRFKYTVSVPLRTLEGLVVGTMTLGSSRAEFSDDDVSLLESVGAQLAVALDNSRLYAQVRHQAEELATTLSNLKQAQTQVVQQERLRALGEMASGIAHDFNNALAPVVGFSDLLLLDPAALTDQQKTRSYLELIQAGAQDAAAVVARLREFYRERDVAEMLRPVDVPPLVEQVLALTQPRWRDQAQLAGRTVAIQTELQPVPPIAGNAPELREALTNLIFNAVDAMPGGGTITVRTHRAGERVLLTVEDTGTGMSEETRRRCLEPFFTTKGENGTGLGLSMVFGTVRRHGGELSITSIPGRGTAVTVSLPPYENDVPPEAVAPAHASVQLCVLVIDDEPAVRRVTAAFLQADGHTVLEASGGREGLELLQRDRKGSEPAIDVVITDRAMPDMNGDQVAAAIKALDPTLPVIMLTGFGALMDPAYKGNTDAVLSKPTNLSALRRTLLEVMAPPG